MKRDPQVDTVEWPFDVGRLLKEIWAVGGFAGPPTDREARLVIKQKERAPGLTDEEWKEGLQPIWWEQRLQMDEMWQVEKTLIALLRRPSERIAGEREVFFRWRAARLAAHHAAAYYGRDRLRPIESELSKAEVQRAKGWTEKGKPWPEVLFDGARPVFVSAEMEDWDDGDR